MFEVTDEALKQIKKSILTDYQILLRVGIIGGGCSGLTYKMDIEEFSNITPDDKTHDTFKDIMFVIDKKSYLFIQDVTLDYQGGLNGKGFTFNNPKAKRTCGCGESFSV